MEYKVRKAEIEDVESIFELILELAEFENATKHVASSVDSLKKDFELFDCFIVENNENEVIALAFYFFGYYTWVGKTLYLDDLYVKPEYRGQKIGTTLMNKVFEVAKETNCNRLRWPVPNWNLNAIEFYQKMGADIDPTWHTCDFDRKGIDNYLTQNSNDE